MRTTIRLNNALLRRTKQRAFQEHTTFTAVVENALRAWLGNKTRCVKPDKVPIPTSGSGGLLAGVDLDNTSSLLDRMDSL